jgi:hypothetical protein
VVSGAQCGGYPENRGFSDSDEEWSDDDDIDYSEDEGLYPDDGLIVD